MVGSNDEPAVRQLVLRAMRKFIFGARCQQSAADEVVDISVECDAAQCDHNLYMRKKCDLAIKPDSAVCQFLACWFVVRRSAASAGRDVGIVKLQPIIETGRFRL